MSSGETSWAWYVTQLSLLKSNKSPTADCTALCVYAMIPFPSGESSSAMCPLSAAHLLPNLHARSVSFSLCVSLLCSLKRNIFYTSACGIKTYWKGELIHQHLHTVAERQSFTAALSWWMLQITFIHWLINPKDWFIHFWHQVLAYC